MPDNDKSIEEFPEPPKFNAKDIPKPPTEDINEFDNSKDDAIPPPLDNSKDLELDEHKARMSIETKYNSNEKEPMSMDFPKPPKLEYKGAEEEKKGGFFSKFFGKKKKKQELELDDKEESKFPELSDDKKELPEKTDFSLKQEEKEEPEPFIPDNAIKPHKPPKFGKKSEKSNDWFEKKLGDIRI